MSVRIQPTRDDIGMIARTVNPAGLNLHSSVANMHEQATDIQGIRQEMATATHTLSSRTEQTTSRLEQTAATEITNKAGNAVSQVVSTMALISDSSKKIADIISAINGIAFQTTILALNAAVEAARAGEQGCDFAVVATEVRSLARRSAAAAKEIRNLIDHSGIQIQNDLRLVADSSQTMADVVSQMQRVNEYITEITVASRAKTHGISQVGQAVALLNEMPQQNAAMIEQSNAAAISMGDQAQRLLDTVRVLSV